MTRYGPHDPDTAPGAASVLVGGIAWGYPSGPTRTYPVPRLVEMPPALVAQRARLNTMAAEA